VSRAVKINGPVACAVVAPVAIESKCGEASRLNLLEEVLPDLGYGNAPVVNLSGEDEQPLTIDFEAVVVPLNNVI
jgi:hypothetical protein